MIDSILTSMKKLLGIAENYTIFDQDIIMHINTSLSTLTQLGIGPYEGFMIEDDTTLWADFLQGDSRWNSIKTYVFLRVRMYFDPPTTSFALDAVKEQIRELEWRLNVEREDHSWNRDSLGNPGTLLELVAGIPIARRIRIRNGKNVWATIEEVEAHMIVREKQDRESDLISDLSSYLTISFEFNDILVDWSMTGSQTRDLRDGYYNLIVSDVGDVDSRAIRVLYGWIKVS